MGARRKRDLQLNPAVKFELRRIDDSISARDVHVTMLNSLRL